ncbi:MAG TPA: type II toxin-antitoxin system RelE/ParE family toxin [Pirellulaceae bacterium]|nr:type II toxin-antitoxin system RelE/ParE family toxin [Pirellulaceae bacterium]
MRRGPDHAAGDPPPRSTGCCGDFRLAPRNRTAAIRFLDVVEETYRRIKADPKLGMRLFRPDREDQDWRFRRIWGFENYLVYYVIGYDKTQVIRVLHGSRDIETALQAGQP